MIRKEDEFRTDVPLSLTRKLDAMLRLFDGDVSLSELITMDLPSQRSMVQARIENLKQSQELFAQGRLDSYSRRYASTMTAGGGSLSIASSSSEHSQNEFHGATNMRSRM